MRPKRAKIVSNKNGSEYYDNFIGKEYDVASMDKELIIELPILSEFKGSTSTWIDDDLDEYKSIMRGLQEAINGETVTTSKVRYDELLEIEKLEEERLVYEKLYKDKKIEDIL